MKKIFTLSTCSTSKKILESTGILDHNFEIQDIKTKSISNEDLDKMKELSGSYESLFSRRAQKYKSLNLKDQNLNEDDFRNYIHNEYTFLKRPVIIDGETIFIGNSKKNIEALKMHISRTK